MNSHTEKIGARRQRIRADHTRIRLILFLSLVIALLLAAAMNENRDLSSQTLAVFTTGVPILLLGAVFPLVCLIAGGIRKRLIPKNQEGGES